MICGVCPESIQPCAMKNRDIYRRRYKIQETLYIGQRHLSLLQSRHVGTSHSSPNHHQLPLIDFPESYQQSEISSLSKAILVLGKARSHWEPNLGCKGAESPGWFDVSPKNSAPDVMHERACCHDEAANHQLPIAAAFWIIWIVPAEECSSLMQNWMRMGCSIHSVIVNVTTTQYTCTLNGVYHPHWLVQRSHHCSHMCMPVHSPWLPVTSMSCKPFLLYEQWLDFFGTDLVYAPLCL